MSGIATVGTGGKLSHGKSKSTLEKEWNELIVSNTQTLQAGKSIISGRNAGETASAAQALANQTGGNIMGFTYE